MKLLVTIPTLSRVDLIVRNKGFLEGVRAPDEVLILDNGRQQIDIAVPIERCPMNLGVSGSWNYFLRRAFVERDFDGLVLLQDDIVWTQTQLDAARRLLVERPDVDLLLAYHQFSVQVHRPANIWAIGFYDERFWPAYCEDDDYVMKMMQARKIYQRFHDLDPLPGSGIEGTHKEVPSHVQTKKLIDKWGKKAIRINIAGAPYYESNRNFRLT